MEENQKPKSNKAIFIVVGILVIIIAALVGYIVFSQKSDKKTSTVNETNTSTSKEEKEDKEENKSKKSSKKDDEEEDEDEKDDEDKKDDEDEDKNENKSTNKTSSSKNTSSSKKDSNSTFGSKKSSTSAADINDNDNYMFKINGTEFKAGDKISDLSKVELSQDERVLEEKVGKNTYLIGGGTIYNSDKKSVFSVTPYNDTNAEITAKEAVIGGFDIGSYQYDSISEQALALNVEVAGGIKLGSSLEDVKKVFGETDDTYYAESLGYTKYTYKSSEVYRSYEITVDKDGKVSEIRWQNLVFND